MVAKHGMIQQIEGCIEQFAGKDLAQKIMEGNENITEKTDKKKTAKWVKNALQKLDASVDDKTRVRIMQNCGYNCAKKNHKVIERAVARREKFGSTDEFLDTEQQKSMKGTKLERDGNILYQFYTPQAFTRPMRCYCGLFRELLKEDTVDLSRYYYVVFCSFLGCCLSYAVPIILKLFSPETMSVITS